MKPGQCIQLSSVNLPFRYASAAFLAAVPGALSGNHTGFAEESDAGTKVVEEVIDTVDATTFAADVIIKNLPVVLIRVLISGLIILIGLLTIGLCKRIVAKLANRKKSSTKNIRKSETTRSILISLFRYLVVFIVLIAILTVFGVDVNSIFAMASISGIIAGFALQTLIKDIIYGVLILAEGSIGVGDFVRINDMKGYIDSVSLRTTVIRNYNGDMYTIPNGEIRTITNMSIVNKRVIVDIRCPYEESRRRLLDIISDEMETAARETDGISGTADILNICAFEPDAMIFRIAVECHVKDYWRIEREIRARIKDRFDAEGIIMPHYSSHDFRYMMKNG